MTELKQTIASRKELLFAIVRKNLKVRYKQSLVGPLWVILQPIVLAILFIMIHSFTGMRSEGIPYPIFVYTALMPWTFFSNAVIFSSGSIVDNAPVIKKIYCPREMFPVASVMTSLVDFLAASLLFVLMIVYYRIPITTNILLLPLVIAFHFIFATGLALACSAVAVYKRDIIIGMPFIMQFWLFASPVMYPLSFVPVTWQTLYLMNPMAGFIESYRTILLCGSLPEGRLILSACVGSVVAFVTGHLLFNKLERRFADVI